MASNLVNGTSSEDDYDDLYEDQYSSQIGKSVKCNKFINNVSVGKGAKTAKIKPLQRSKAIAKSPSPPRQASPPHQASPQHQAFPMLFCVNTTPNAEIFILPSATQLIKKSADECDVLDDWENFM